MKNKLLFLLISVVLIVSIGVTAFAIKYPDSTASVGDVVVVASKTYAALNGDSTIYNYTYSQSNYTSFVNYAVNKGIIDSNSFSSYTVPATRLDAVAILAKVMPENSYTPINTVYNIYDIPGDDVYYKDALMLMRAGIFTDDGVGQLNPSKQVTLSELATYISRLAFPEKRKSFESESIRTPRQAYMLNYTDNMNNSKEGIESGWEMDNRAGNLRLNLDGNDTLVDVMDDESSRLIRHFNYITKDKIDASFTFRLLEQSLEGVNIEFCDGDGSPVYRIVCADKSYNILLPDGSLKRIYTPDDYTKSQKFRVIIDLEKGIASTEINNVFYGYSPLLGDRIKYFAYRTPKEGKSVMGIGSSFMYSNYAVYEDLRFYTEIPQSFDARGDVTVSNGEFVINNGGRLSKRFEPLSGNVAFSFNLFTPAGSTNKTFSLCSEGKSVATFNLIDGNLYAGTTLIKPDLSDKLWHKMRIEANTATQSVVFKVNAKVLATIPFENSVNFVNEIVFTNTGANQALIDDIKVYNLVDYNVPAPVIPAGANDYIIGINICSLWVNGEHWGWGCVTPYDDIKPILGYYDEGIPELADWENKYMAEHGIDFQAFCWYANQSNAPMKSTRLSAQLDEAYLHSKYGDKVKFCLLWEAANASRPTNSEAFRNYFVPYWIENYFTDPRYMTIDNKLVFSIFGVDSGNADNPSLINRLNLKADLDYMREEVKKLGFDGIIVTASHTGANYLKKYGIDGWQAYNWGTNGYQYSTNQNGMNNNFNKKDVYAIPTISVGFNSIPWHGIRYPLMSVSDFKSINEWVRDTYLPTKAVGTTKGAGTWNDKLVWLSTWNEYGEGTYIMPSDGLNGFGYLDVLREVYTRGGAHTDVVPSAEQKKNFNHLYPQDIRILRAFGNYTFTAVNDRVIDLTKSGEFANNFTLSNCAGPDAVSSSGTTFSTYSSETADAIIYFEGPAYTGFTADNLDRIEVVASGIPEGQSMQLFYQTTVATALFEGNSVRSAESTGTGEQTFVLVPSSKANFKGNIKLLRLDPLQDFGITFKIKSIKLISKKTFDVYINDKQVEFSIMPETHDASNAAMIPFEPGKSMIHFMMYVYHEWDYDTKVLKLYRDDKCVEFTVGSNIAKVNGVNYNLSTAVYQVDNIPMLPIIDLVDIFGFEYRYSNNAFYITTPEKPIFDSLNTVEGQWTFDYAGNTCGWNERSWGVSLDYGDGTLIIVSVENDPVIRTRDVNFDASKYSKIEIRCRWKMTNSKGSGLGFYFTTSAEPSESQSKFVGVDIGEKSDTFQTFTLNMAANNRWTGTIQSLRFDPFNANGYCEIDYIKLIP